MKKEIKQELKPLMYYIEKMPSKEIDKLYKEIALNNDNVRYDIVSNYKELIDMVL